MSGFSALFEILRAHEVWSVQTRLHSHWLVARERHEQSVLLGEGSEVEFACERGEPELKERKRKKKPLIRHNASYFKAINVSWKTSLISPPISCRGSLTEAGASRGAALATHLSNSANTTHGKGSKWCLFLAPSGLTRTWIQQFQK